MLRDLKSLERKKYQHAVNKAVRQFNKSMKEDWLWNGRFIMRQDRAWFRSFEDHSGALFEFVLVLEDTKTGLFQLRLFNNFNGEHRIYSWANECITMIWNVWKEDPDPYEQAHIEGRVPLK